MSAVAGASAAGAATASAVASPGGGAPGSLLVAPLDGALPSAPLAFFYLVEAQDREMNIHLGTKKANAMQQQREQALVEQKKAIQDAIEASKKKSFWDDLGGVFGKVAKVAAVVASVAAAVATAGAATPLAALAIAGAVMSCASFVDSEFHVLEKLGVDPKIAGWIGTGMAIGGVLCSVGTGLIAGQQAANATLSTVKTASTVTTATGLAAKGATEIASADAKGDEGEALAEEAAAKAKWSQLQRLILSLLDDMSASEEQSERTMGHIRDTKTIQNQTMMSTVSVRA